MDRKSAEAKLRAMLEANWPAPDFAALLESARAAWNEDEVWALWVALMFSVPVMSDYVFPGGVPSEDGGQAVMMTPSDESLAPFRDRARALAAVDAAVELTMAASTDNPDVRAVLQRVSREHKGNAVYMMIMMGLSTLMAIDAEMPGAGLVTLEKGLKGVTDLET